MRRGRENASAADETEASQVVDDAEDHEDVPLLGAAPTDTIQDTGQGSTNSHKIMRFLIIPCSFCALQLLMCLVCLSHSLETHTKEAHQ